MKRRWRGAALVALIGLVIGELAVRGSGLGNVLDDAAVWSSSEDSRSALMPNLGGWWRLGRWTTDADGHRVTGEVLAPEAEAPLRVLVVAGEYGLGAGLDDDQTYASVLERLLRDDLGVAGADVQLVVPALDWDGRCEGLLAAVDRWRPDAVVLEIAASDIGPHADKFRVADPVIDSPALDLSGIALVDAARISLRRRAIASIEQRLGLLDERDGLTSRANRWYRLRARWWSGLDADPVPGFDPVATMEALIHEQHSPSRRKDLSELERRLIGLFDQVQRRGARVVLLSVGDSILMETPRSATLENDAEFVWAPPFDLDAEMRLHTPEERPAALIHTATAEQLTAVLHPLATACGGGPLPGRITRRAEEVSGFHGRKLGEFNQARHETRSRLQREVRFDGAGEKRQAGVLAGLSLSGEVIEERVELALLAGFTDHLVVDLDAEAAERSGAPTLSFKDGDAALPSKRESVDGVLRLIYSHRFGAMLPTSQSVALEFPTSWLGTRFRRVYWRDPSDLDVLDGEG